MIRKLEHFFERQFERLDELCRILFDEFPALTVIGFGLSMVLIIVLGIICRW